MVNEWRGASPLVLTELQTGALCMPTQETAMTLLQSADPEEMREGAYLAGKIRLEKALPLLFTHLQSKHKGVQEAADYALRKIGGAKVVQGAIPLLSCEDAPIRNIGIWNRFPEQTYGNKYSCIQQAKKSMLVGIDPCHCPAI